MTITPSWLPRVRRRLARLRGSGVVVAVSGGGDSVGLLRVLAGLSGEYALRLSVAHLDHGTRGAESRLDAGFSGDLAASLGLPFDLGEWRASRPGHFEADARRGRYDWLAGVARERGAGFVAVGQTVDDQAETVLHRVIRGTGLRGVAGIPGRRPIAPGVELVRPLLDVTRREVRDYLASIGQPFREDASNLDTSRTRARIRHRLLPELAEGYNPLVAEALARLGRLAGEAGRTLDRLARDRAASIVLESRPDRVVLDRLALSRLDPFGRAEVLRLAWRDAGWPEVAMDARRWRHLARLDSPGRTSVGAGVEAEVSADRLVLRRSSRGTGEEVREPVEWSVPGRIAWGDGWLVATLDDGQICDEWVDFDRLALPLLVRAPRAGDRFGPLGMADGSQSLNDFFRGRRVAREDRGRVAVVADAGGIVWVAGHRIAHRVRRTEATRRVLGLRFEPLFEKPG